CHTKPGKRRRHRNHRCRLARRMTRYRLLLLGLSGLLLVSSGKGHTAGGDLPPQFCKAANTTACPCRTLPLAVQPMLTSEVAVF
ncbi:MAG: hypothetical protein RSF70_00625, partial [Ruthenibacterium sp.]